MTETVVRVRPGEPTGAKDAFDKDILGPPTELELKGALFAPAGVSGAASEPAEIGRSPVISEPTLYFRDQWPDITEHDQVRVRGLLYDVEGIPGDWRHDGGPGGLVVRLKHAGG